MKFYIFADDPHTHTHIEPIDTERKEKQLDQYNYFDLRLSPASPNWRGTKPGRFPVWCCYRLWATQVVTSLGNHMPQLHCTTAPSDHAHLVRASRSGPTNSEIFYVHLPNQRSFTSQLFASPAVEMWCPGMPPEAHATSPWINGCTDFRFFCFFD